MTMTSFGDFFTNRQCRLENESACYGAQPAPFSSEKSMLKITLLLVLLSACYVASSDPLPGVPAPPDFNARSYALMDYDSGAILAEKDPDKHLGPASLTKIMTVYVAGRALSSGAIALNDETTVSEKAWRMEGSRMFLEVNKKVTVDELLQGIIVQSGNDASVALAERISGSEDVFASMMNQYAQELGMSNTHFTNSTGLPDPLHYTTARDLARLSAALIREFPDLYPRFAEKEYTYNGIRQPNRNRLLSRDSSVDGIKTGHTESAGHCLVASALRNGMRLISVVMETDSDVRRVEASQALLDYGFRFFETHRLYKANDPVTQARLWKGAQDQVALGLQKDLVVTVPRGQYEALEAVAVVDEPIVAPVASNQVLGSVQVRFSDKELLSVPLVALKAVAQGPWYHRLWDQALLLFE